MRATFIVVCHGPSVRLGQLRARTARRSQKIQSADLSIVTQSARVTRAVMRTDMYHRIFHTTVSFKISYTCSHFVICNLCKEFFYTFYYICLYIFGSKSKSLILKSRLHCLYLLRFTYFGFIVFMLYFTFIIIWKMKCFVKYIVQSWNFINSLFLTDVKQYIYTG